MDDRKRKIISFPGMDPAVSPDPEDRIDSKGPGDASAEGQRIPGFESEQIPHEVQDAVKAKEREDQEKIWSIELPTALAEREVKLYIFAVISALLGVVMSIALASPHFLILLGFAAFFVYTGISSRFDFRDGKIVELSLLCFNVQKTSRLSSDFYVSFRTEDEIPTYYRFLVRDKRGVFFPGCPYLVYYHTRNPSQLLAFYQL